MGGNKNNHSSSSSANGSGLTEDSLKRVNGKHDIDDANYFTIRINKSHFYGAGCALFGGLLVIAVQRFMGIGAPTAYQGSSHVPTLQHTPSSASFIHSQQESHPTEGLHSSTQDGYNLNPVHSESEGATQYKISTNDGRHPVSKIIYVYLLKLYVLSSNKELIFSLALYRGRRSPESEYPWSAARFIWLALRWYGTWNYY